MADSRSNVPCRFFAWGKCRSGLSCPFSHDGPLVQSSPTESWQRRQQEKSDVGKKADTDMTKDGDDKEDKDDFTRAMAGASVRFEDGGRVAKVSLPEDFSAVQLSSLPLEGVSAESVRAFLGGLGFSVAVTDVRLLPHGDAAVVRAEDATFSWRVCAHMAAGSRWGSSVVRAVRVAAPMPKDHTAGRVDCRKVHISWHKPVRTAWLRFGSERTAQRVSRAFSAGVYRVLDQKVVAGEPERTVSTRGGYRTVAAEWTVRLSDLPAAADTRDVISRAIGKPADRPLSIEVSQPTYQAAPGSRISSTGDQDEDYCAAIVRSLLGQSGTVEYWETTLESTAKRVKATARFLDEADARAAATQLNGSRLPFHANGRLTVQLVCSVRFKVGSSVYDALAPRISALAGSAWKTAHVRFFAYPSPRLQPAYRILKLEGESDRAVAVAKGELDRILAGTVARDRQEKPLWDEAISSSNSLWLEIQRQARSDSPDSLIVVRSKTRSQMLLFGSQAACDHSQTRLRALLLDNEKTSHTIPLQPNQFLWACREGLASIADRIGPGKASLDVVSTPKQICIQGSLHDLCQARDLVCSQNTSQMTSSTLAKAADCCVCWTEDAAPVRTVCGHVYCHECFDNGCAAPAPGEAEFTLLCHSLACGRRLPLRDLQEHLSSAAFEDLLAHSFATFVQRHPDQLRFCPTPDCGHIYRLLPSSSSSSSESSRSHTCANCLQVTCAACAEPHDGAMTCGDYRDLRSGGHAAFQRLKKELGVKDCPKCGIAIEKVTGCNHMICIACRTHICWVCLSTFSSGDLVYTHMQRIHGGHIDLP